MFDAEEAMKDGAPLVHDDKRTISPCISIWSAATSPRRSPTPTWSWKTRSRACRSGTLHRDHRQRGRVRHQRQVHVYMNTQTLFIARNRMARALNMPETDMRIIQRAVGGGFGGKSCDDNNAMVSALLAIKPASR